MQELDFVRSNQKSYLRIFCNDYVMQSYEYQMCQHNVISSFLKFQERNQNGQQYLYFEVSGMQSLDIFLQTRKLRRNFALKLAKAIVKLCKELAEYALRIECIQFEPKYVMISSNGEELFFLYTFDENAKKYMGLEQLLECCIENLDYADEFLTEQLYHVYECFLEQEDNFFLAKEMEQFMDVLADKKAIGEATQTQDISKQVTAEEIVMEEFEKNSVSVFKESPVAKKEYRRLMQGLVLLFFADIGLLVFWKPLTILKVFFCTAMGGVLLALAVYRWKQDMVRQKEQTEQQQRETFIREYEELSECAEEAGGGEIDGTQIISLESMEGVLYNLQEREPQYIYIGMEGKIIGKDAKRAQIHIPQESISRVHALIIKEGKTCFVEDLNSTNGTRINEKVLKPRTRYALKQGDKVCFADLEYIFR